MEVGIDLATRLITKTQRGYHALMMPAAVIANLGISLSLASIIILDSCSDLSTQGQGTKARAIENSAKQAEADFNGNEAGTQI